MKKEPFVEIKTKIINAHFINLIIDDNRFELRDITNYVIGEKVSISLDNKYALEVFTDDSPHFFGEGNLSFQLTHLNSLNENQILDNFYNPVQRIRIVFWKAKGLFKKKYISQIELYDQSNCILSIGFFYKEFSSFLATGELYISKEPVNVQYKMFDFTDYSS